MIFGKAGNASSGGVSEKLTLMSRHRLVGMEVFVPGPTRVQYVYSASVTALSTCL